MQEATARDGFGEAASRQDQLTLLVQGSSARLAHLSNEALLTQTRFLVGKTNRVLAALLEHLAEVEARGLHREARCSSLYTYCKDFRREQMARRRDGCCHLSRRRAESG